MGKRVFGSLVGLVDPFRVELTERGYRPTSAEAVMAVMRDLSRWLATEGIDPAGLTPALVNEFAEFRRRAGRRRFRDERQLAVVVEFLRAAGVVPADGLNGELSPLETVLGDYRRWLTAERGLAVKTVGRYEATARLLLSERSRVSGGSGVEGLTGADVTEFLIGECARVGRGSAKGRPTELRSLLRFLFLGGLISLPLADGVPGVAGWHGAGLPAVVDQVQVAALLADCDRSTGIGRRDYVILVLLARMGLRAGEVAGLTLDDIDWRVGEILVRGKGRRTDRLPLPVDVGEALATYLSGGRPAVASRAVFIRGRAPLVGLSALSVGSVVRHACRRAGVTSVGAHRLRHAAAADMLRHGASLIEIGQVLRHRDVATTAAYAKVDRDALLAVAKPWPQVVAS